MGNQENDSDKVDLLIRCAMQSFDDTPITCPTQWTIRQLKEQLAIICPSKPEASRQRLIYSGHCLQDDRTLHSVFENRSVDTDRRVIHLVCPPRDITEFDSVRRRNVKNNETRPTNVPHQPSGLSQQQQQQMPPISSNMPNANFNGWPNFAANYGAFPMQQFSNQNADMQSAYNAYVMFYTNYMQQMMGAMNSGTNSFISAQAFSSQHPTFPNAPPVTPPAQPAAPLAGAADMVAAAPAAGDIVQEAIGGGAEPPQRDFLDIVHKAIRICFLIMLVYVYSSVERFFGVLLFIIVVWFVQARRDRNNRQQANRELANAVNNVRHLPQANEAENEVNGTTDSEMQSNENREVNAWTIFWSTCYTFITSFFTSLIPDNPVPANMN